MSNPEITQYFDATEHREIRADLIRAVELVGDKKVAIDCGCGAGADIAFLLSKGFTVHGFDIEDEAIARCTQRFNRHQNLFLSKSDFSSYAYPHASLVVADASLFFCPRNEFDGVWEKIYACLFPGGIFCGSFLGTEDTMANSRNHKVRFWPDVSVFNEQEVRTLFLDYEVKCFTEHKTTGETPAGMPHDWHVFSVVARKPNS